MEDELYPQVGPRKPRLDVLVEWELAAIEAFLCEVPSFLEERFLASGGTNSDWYDDHGHLTPAAAMSGAKDLALGASVMHLNDLVDLVLLLLQIRIG